MSRAKDYGKKKFTVHIKRVMIERWPIEVEARTLAAAKRMALKEARDESTDWDNVECDPETVMAVDDENGMSVFEAD